jgi:hypothetical protein
MPVLLHMTSRIQNALNDGNLRGEARWERNVLEALISHGIQVHTTLNVKANDQLELPSNFHNGVNLDWIQDSIYISHGSPSNAYLPPLGISCKYYLIQWFNGPQIETARSLQNLIDTNPSNTILTTNFLSGGYYAHLDARFPGRVRHIEGPAVPDVDLTIDNFNKNILLWAYRDPMQFLVVPSTIQLCNWIKVQFEKNPNLRLVFLMGELESNLIGKWNFQGHHHIFNTYSSLSPLKAYQDRIDFKYDLHWHEVLNIYKETKLVVSPARPLGGPPYEASMFGIPIVLEDKINPFQDNARHAFFPELLTAPCGVNQVFINHLDKLSNDHNIYRKHGDAYRNYVAKKATYKGYIQNLNNMFDELKWDCKL